MIPASRAHLNIAATSHAGMSGKNNEDRYAVSAYHLDNGVPTPAVLAVVADGIGGHRAGEVAAEMAVEIISRVVAASDASRPLQTLQEAIIQASKVISDEAEANPEQKGMGSTCACAWIIGAQLYTASVGDSRIYLIRDNTIRQLSTDHTWVQEAIDQGLLQPEQAHNHPNAHVIRRYLGSRNGVIPDLRLKLYAGENEKLSISNQGTNLHPRDILFLCSDGLTDLVDDGEILAAVQTRRIEAALEELIDMANQRGGHDNITLVALSIPSVEQPTIPVVVRKQRSRTLVAAAVLALMVVLAALAAGLSWLVARWNDPQVTVSPPAIEQATLFPAPVRTENPPETPLPAVQSTKPVATPQPETTPLPAGDAGGPTLTPWPTNTLSP
jgi:serine/threonine protein phosphatase PrpC